MAIKQLTTTNKSFHGEALYKYTCSTLKCEKVGNRMKKVIVSCACAWEILKILPSTASKKYTDISLFELLTSSSNFQILWKRERFFSWIWSKKTKQKIVIRPYIAWKWWILGLGLLVIPCNNGTELRAEQFNVSLMLYMSQTTVICDIEWMTTKTTHRNQFSSFQNELSAYLSLHALLFFNNSGKLCIKFALSDLQNL